MPIKKIALAAVIATIIILYFVGKYLGSEIFGVKNIWGQSKNSFKIPSLKKYLGSE